ncbi:MAG: MIOREX complex component 7 [Xenococcaceae cyanobacterium MO_188.B32]|nr:MIOREX complex component 7 [Xenococcaceae cyanobacterium MO_188.B32]
MSNRLKYFTISVTKGCGVADQINQWSGFYKLGLSLGYKYVHTPLRNYRSSNKIYNFLAINNYFFFKRILFVWLLKVLRYTVVDLELNDELLKAHNVYTFQELQSFVKDYISEQSSLINKSLLIRFKVTGRRKFLSLIQLQIPNFLDGLDLRSIYFRSRRINPRRSRFVEDKLKLLVHIRQGDTALIETPWQTFLPIKRPKSLQFTEVKDLNDPRFNYFIRVNEFYDFIKKFTSGFEDDIFSMVISSDGFERAFQKIYRNINRLNWSSEQIEAIKESESLYNDKSFHIFKKFKHSVCLIGENDENLFDLIHSSLMADIIVVSTQQRMLPTLIANYYDLDNPVIMILLYKAEKLTNHQETLSLHKDKLERLSLHKDKAQLIHVNLNHYDIEDVVSRVKNYLREISKLT